MLSISTLWSVLINLLHCMYFDDLSLFEQAYFAKYDAVELYLSKRTYPSGLSYVEKNTFRRFCKKFTIKGLYGPQSKLKQIKNRLSIL